jgi:SSS family transporter
LASILSEGIGYLILLGVGLVMAIAVTLLVRVEHKWLGTKKTFEWFYTAGRNVKTGLIAASLVSAWTWAATLLQSSTVAYQYGISGPFWYAAGASIQMVLFGILVIELKRKAPSSHTFPEIINARFGDRAHKVFLFFGLMTNTIVTAMLVLGGAAVIHSLTGVNIYLASFLIPVGVIIYTFFGGLKATFFAEYLNAAFIFAIVLVFVVFIYFLNPQLGGIEGMYEKLSNAASLRPVDGNAAGAYLTMASTGALIFGIINIVGNFGTVFVDQAYWQKAIAARPKAAVKGFLIGGLAWFAIPFTLATTLGLAAIATNLYLTPEQIQSGLVAPTAASFILGDTGAILMLTVLFTAVTAAGSAELVSVSSLVTYDVYRTYVKPWATGRELMRISRITIIGFGLGMGMLSSVLLQLGASLQYVYLAMGILIGPAVVPIVLTVSWKKTNGISVILGSIGGLIAGVIAWLTSTWFLYGQLSVETTGQTTPLLLGNIVSISVGAAITIIGSLVRPDHFNYEVMKQRILVVDDKIRSIIEKDTDDSQLQRYGKFVRRYAIALSLLLVVIWPLPLYFSGYVFSLQTYIIWVGLAVAWASTAACIIILLPLIESRAGILQVLKKIASTSITHIDRDGKSQTRRPLSTTTVLYQPHEEEIEADAKSTRVLVAIDGSFSSLRALNYAESLFNKEGGPMTKIYLLHIMEWTDEEDESMDAEIVSKMHQEGRRMLKSLVPSPRSVHYERIVRLGDPASKIAEIAEKLESDLIIMGRKGLGRSQGSVGHVTARVLQLTSRPVVLIK